MSPSRVPGSKNLRFDRVFPEPVGRISNSSGTSDPATFAAYNLLLTKLWRADQVDALCAFKRGELSMPEIAQADREIGLAKANLMSGIRLRKNLWTARDELLPEKPADRTTRRNYYDSLHGLEKVSPYLLHGHARLGPKATVADLARVDWPRLKAWWLAPTDEGGYGRSGSNWMHLRRAISWMLTQLLGDAYHPDRRAIMKVMPTAAEHEREPDLTADEFWAITEHVTPAVKDALVTLVASGMRLGEYERCTRFHLKPDAHAIMVPGRKTKGSLATVYIALDLWPYVERAVPMPRRRLAIQRAFKRGARAIGKGELVLHDLRHAYAQFAVDAGVAESKVQKALRHANPAMTRRYTKRRDKGEVGQAVGQVLTKGRKHA